ncbi:Sulfate sulfate transporter [Pelomyxa schiedti]|nr:Sulfate sulfate transporter [Pelomyxa schiedti]
MIDDDAPERCLSPDGSGFIRSDKVPPLSASSNLIDLISASNRRAKRYGCWFIVETFLSVTPSVIVGFMLAALLVMLWGFDETWRALNWQGWATLIVTIGLVLVLLRDVTHPAVVVMAANLALVSLGVISMDDVCEGFGNTGVVTIAIMLIVSEGIKETKALDLVGRYILPKGKQARYLWWAQIRLLFPVQCLSAFLNNTPCVSMNIPVVMNYCKTTGRSPSKMLMPLSFAVIVGGLITLVGTSTNMMVVGMLAVVAPDVKLGMFEIGYIGIPLSIITVLYTILASGLLPDKESLSAFFEQNQHDYTVTVVVQKESVVVGNTIGGAGLRSLSGLFLFAIERNSEFLSEVNPDTVILPQDVLYFTGAVKSVKELLAIDGLQPGEHTKIAGVQDKTLRLMEVVLSPFSNLLGKTIKESQFRTKYKASVVAVSRHGEPIKGKLGNLRLEQGDLLLVLAPPNFIRDYSSHFLLIAEMSGSGLFTYIRWQVALSLVCLLVPVCISAVTKVPLATAGMFGIFILVISGLLTVQQCLKAIEGLVLITVAGSFALSIAITSSGAAVTIASSIVKLVGHWGNFGLLLGIYLPTVALTNIMSNAAVVALMFPIVWSLVSSTGLSVKAAMYVLMVSASSCFILPIGYQTNLMVMGPGSYKMVDFIKFGTPLTLLLGIATLVIPWAMWC